MAVLYRLCTKLKKDGWCWHTISDFPAAYGATTARIYAKPGMKALLDHNIFPKSNFQPQHSFPSDISRLVESNHRDKTV